MGREAHEDPARRYVASVAAGVFYIALGLVGGAVVGLLTPSRANWCWPWPAWRCWAPSPAAWPRR